MSRSPSGSVRQLVGGGAFVLGADALQLPSALLLGAYLSRKLGADGLGLYFLATSLVGWIELVVGSLFSRATVHLVGEARDWQPIAALVLRWHIGASLLAFTALWVVVALFPQLLGASGLGPIVLLLSLEIPLLGVARCHTHLLIGLGRFRARAYTSVARWTTRFALGVLLVELGLGVRGAILGSVGASAVETVVARWFVRPRLTVASPPGLRRKLFDYSWPLFLHSMALQLFHRLGLLLLVPLGSTVATAGVYGAADSLLRLRRTLGQALTPLLLSTLSRMARDDRREEARRLSGDALRFVLFTTPALAAIAGGATPIMAWLFGSEFRKGGPILAVLIAGALPFLVISVVTAIFTAASRPRVPVVLTAPMVPLALAGYWLAVPRWEGLGAAWVTTLTILASGLACLFASRRLLGVAPPAATVLRAAVIGTGVYFAAGAVPLTGAWLLLELPALFAAGLGLFVLLGEASAAEREWLRREGASVLARLRRRGGAGESR